MTSTLPRQTLDNEAIRQLAVEPERPLFPLLSQAEAMLPLVVVLAFLPALYAVNSRTLSETGAWEGLTSLRCLVAENLTEFVDPAAGDPAHPFRFQPPLMSWLTALGMLLAGTGRMAGLILPAYLCTAGLIIAGYVLGRRIGGEQLGLVTAVLMAFNPQILEGAQESVPQSVACLFAVLCLAGIVAHWQKSSAVTSYQLLLGGISLGCCVLAGGPLAVAVVLLVLAHVACWKFDAWFRGSTVIAHEKSQFNRRTAFRSAAVLAATAFAVGGWSVMFMSSRYGFDFWSSWLTGGWKGSIDARSSAGWEGAVEGLRELNRLVRPLFGLTLLGLVGVVRDLYRADVDPARHHRGLLLVWIAVAFIFCILCRSSAGTENPSYKMWETLLAVPLLISAALGLIDIAERRIGFLPAMAFGGLALADALLLADQWLSVRGAEPVIPLASGIHLRGPVTIGLALLAVGGIWLANYAWGRDARRRVVLTGMLAAIVAANCVWGAVAVRRTSPGDRELDQLQTGMARLPRMDQCTFVALAPPGTSLASRPPPQLVYALASVWPGAEINYASSWEDAAKQALANAGRDEDFSPVFVAWSPRGRIRGAAPAADLRSAAPPFLYRGLEVAAYVRAPAQTAIGSTTD